MAGLDAFGGALLLVLIPILALVPLILFLVALWRIGTALARIADTFGSGKGKMSLTEAAQSQAHGIHRISGAILGEPNDGPEWRRLDP